MQILEILNMQLLRYNLSACETCSYILHSGEKVSAVVINMGRPVKHGTLFVNGFPFDFNISVILIEKLNNIKYPSN